MDITYVHGDDISLKIVVNNSVDLTNVHHYVYYIIDNNTNETIGEVMIYQTDNEDEFLYCGNVGIEIYEKYRYKGYASKAFELAKTALSNLGFTKVILTCEKDNVPSYKAMEKVGARYVDEMHVPENNFAYEDGLREIKVYEYDLEEKGKIK